jgi:hypothetical protein
MLPPIPVHTANSSSWEPKISINKNLTFYWKACFDCGILGFYLLQMDNGNSWSTMCNIKTVYITHSLLDLSQKICIYKLHLQLGHMLMYPNLRNIEISRHSISSPCMLPDQSTAKPLTLARSRTYPSHPTPYTPPPLPQNACIANWSVFFYIIWWW